MDFSDITFANPWCFLLLAVIPLLAILSHKYKIHKNPTFKVSQIPDSFPTSHTDNFGYKLPALLRYLVLVLLIIALARPQAVSSDRDINTKGIDIVIAMDVSTSMEAEDFRPNRLEAAKSTASEFIGYRKNDRIGLVIFAAESFTQCPVTFDHNILISFFDDIKTGMLEDGTAIGMGLSTAVNRLKSSKAKSKVIILLTDGVNNTGKVSPLTAAEFARNYGIKVYTIGVGTEGVALYPIYTPMGKHYMQSKVEIDEDLLRKIARETGGAYFRATNNSALEEIYHRIDLMEKTDIMQKKYAQKEDNYSGLLLVAGIFLISEFAFKSFIFRVIP